MLVKKIKGKVRRYVMPYYDKVFEKSIIQHSRHAIPDFLIIGAKKAGTTSLAQYLSRHPSIIPPKKKEAGYFSWGKPQGLAHYLRNFPVKATKGDNLTFEATPAYIYSKQAPKDILRLFPDIKLIAILRDPIRRAFSDWTFLHHSTFIKAHRWLYDERPFRQAVEEEIRDIHAVSRFHRYLDKGKYARQLKHWYEFFSQDRLLLLDNKDLKQTPRKTLRKVTDFLDISAYYADFQLSKERVNELVQEPDQDSAKTFKTFNANIYKEPLDPDIEQQLREFYEPYDEELVQLTGTCFSWMG